jgi:hypothetical protein
MLPLYAVKHSSTLNKRIPGIARQTIAVFKEIPKSRTDLYLHESTLPPQANKQNDK